MWLSFVIGLWLCISSTSMCSIGFTLWYLKYHIFIPVWDSQYENPKGSNNICVIVKKNTTWNNDTLLEQWTPENDCIIRLL